MGRLRAPRSSVWYGQLQAPVAQGIERAPPERKAAGSNPARRIATPFGPRWARRVQTRPQSPSSAGLPQCRGVGTAKPRGLAERRVPGLRVTDLSHERSVTQDRRSARRCRSRCPSRWGYSPVATPPGVCSVAGAFDSLGRQSQTHPGPSAARSRAHSSRANRRNAERALRGQGRKSHLARAELGRTLDVPVSPSWFKLASVP
jgi:hypothetical protein